MALLTLKSEEQSFADMARLVLERAGLNDLNPGSILSVLLQTVAKENYAQYYQMLQIIRNYNLDTTTGSDLDNRAFEYGLTRVQAVKATGNINILREAGFTKISTTYYSGFRSAIAGDTTIYVNDASKIAALTNGSYTLILGRGTPNEEQVNFTKNGSNPTNFVNYYRISLSTPLTYDHALDETVILKQGNDINLPAGLVVHVPATGNSQEIVFTTSVQATLLAGEAEVTDIPVEASQTGTVGNIPVLAITGTTAFPSPPFTGAQAQNLAAFSNGKDYETDTQLRSRIRSAIQGISQSTVSGISNAINGLVDPVTAKRVVSSNIIIPDTVANPVDVYIDDGTGFEPSFSNEGEEVIIQEATGGEVRVQVGLFPIVKAQVVTLNASPFDMSTNGLTLSVNVGTNSETITFFTTDFAIPSAATAYEVVAAINNRSLLLEARTAGDGGYIVINAKADANDNIQVTGGTANVASKLNFPTSKVFTFYLYKNDVPLSKDGQTASIKSASSGPYNFSGISRTLTVIVDGKSANPQTITIQPSDFNPISEAATASAAQIAAIINLQLAGAVATADNGAVRITSNTLLSSASKIQVTGGTANSILNFSTSQVTGADEDYILNPELGVIQLNAALNQYDLLTAGTRNTSAFFTASNAGNYTFAGGETLIITVDGMAPQTITFIAASNQTAQQVSAYINQTLVGAMARVRTRGPSSYLEIATNTLASTGSLYISASSTANTIFGFTTAVTKANIDAHTAFQLSGSSGPFPFVEGQSLVVVIDNQPANSYTIPMSYSGSVTSGTDTTHFGASLLTSIFNASNELANYYLVFKTGSNTTSGTVNSIANPTGHTFKYNFATPPANFANFQVNDQFSATGATNASNNGNFLITALATQNTVYPAVLSANYSNPASLTPLTGNRYLIGANANTATAASVIAANLSTPTGLTPTSGDKYIVAPNAQTAISYNILGLYTDPSSAVAVNGNAYIVNGVGTGAWTGHNNQIATYNGVGTPGWVFTTPTDKQIALNTNTGIYYQFSSGSGTWAENDWGSKAGKVATWGGSSWSFTTPQDMEVRNVTSISKLYQYSSGSNTWTENDWGGRGNEIAQWTGSAWSYTVPTTNDVVLVSDVSQTYQYSGTTWAPFVFWVEVANTSGVVETTSSATGLLGERRQISSYNSGTGAIVLASAVSNTPVLGDTFIVLPYTASNVVDYFNNKKITSLSTAAAIALADQALYIQISSLSDGSNGFVEIAGGTANLLLLFGTGTSEGVPGYTYYTGLTKLVHKTIYGDETDLISYPGAGAAGIKFRVLAPTVLDVSVSLQVTLQSGVTLSSVENDILTQVLNYINNLGIGSEVIVSNIVAAVLSLSTVLDCKVLTPTSNIIIASNQLARTKASIILVESV